MQYHRGGITIALDEMHTSVVLGSLVLCFVKSQLGVTIKHAEHFVSLDRSAYLFIRYSLVLTCAVFLKIE